MENIIPAVPQINEKPLKELSPQEFQQLLSSWFHEKGIIQDMKSYLKFQMINGLNNTVIGKNMKKDVPGTYSLAQQAIHLIVAEYLLQNKCHFTFSLFRNEVNLTNILPQHKLFFCNDTISKEAANIFDKENLVNILELIGIPKENEHFQIILSQYFGGDMNPLLSCLVDAIGKNIKGPSMIEQDCKTDIDNEDEFMNNIYQVIQSLNLPQRMQEKLLHSVKFCYDLKSKSFENDCIKLVNKFKKELSARDKRFHNEEKQKRLYKKKISKLLEENESLKKKINLLLKENEIIQNEKIVTQPCYLNHCNQKCNEASILYETYRKEIDVLRAENNTQKKDIYRLNGNCNELLKELNCCQNKINLVSTRIQHEALEDVNLLATGQTDKYTENVSLDSDTTVTEEILQQARQKLKALEEESKELDLSFSKFVIK